MSKMNLQRAVSKALPAFAPLPLGLLVTGGFLDLIHLGTSIPGLTRASFWSIVTGLALASVGAALRVFQQEPTPPTPVLRAIDLRSASDMLFVLALFAASTLLRLGQPQDAPSALAITLELGALLAGTFTACIGSQVVPHHLALATRMHESASAHKLAPIQAFSIEGQNATKRHNASTSKIDLPIVKTA